MDSLRQIPGAADHMFPPCGVTAEPKPCMNLLLISSEGR